MDDALIKLVDIYGYGISRLQGWLGSKDATLHAGEGTIQTARWSGTLVAWANNVGIKVSIRSNLVRMPNLPIEL